MNLTAVRLKVLRAIAAGGVVRVYVGGFGYVTRIEGMKVDAVTYWLEVNGLVRLGPESRRHVSPWEITAAGTAALKGQP